MRYILAVDVGGTQMRVAVYLPETPTPVRVERIPSHGADETVLDRLVNLIDRLWPADGPVAAMGVSVAGPTDPHRGIVMTTPNIKEWVNFPLAERLQERFGVPVYLGNDANLAGLAEWQFGAGRGHHNVLYLTISTGIGGGVIVDDRLLIGAQGLAAELGHVVVDSSRTAPICGCGFRGHLEAFSSGTAIERYVAAELAAGKPSILSGHPSARAIAEAARAGDRLARKAFQRAGMYLGIGVANYLHIFNPSILILGGGVSRSGPLLRDPFEASLREHVFHPQYLESLTITYAQLGDDAGLLGALALAQMELSSSRPAA